MNDKETKKYRRRAATKGKKPDLLLSDSGLFASINVRFPGCVCAILVYGDNAMQNKRSREGAEMRSKMQSMGCGDKRRKGVESKTSVLSNLQSIT